jgi:hypothetical protein
MNPFGMFYSFQFVLLVACAGLYYKAAEIENASGILWAGLSVMTFALTWLFLHWGMIGNLFGQAVLLVAITLVRVLRDRRQNR